MEVVNIPQTKTYDLSEEEKVPIIKSWLGRGGLQLIHLQNPRKRYAKQWKGCFPHKVKNSYCITIKPPLPLQYYKLKSICQEWMSRLHIKAMDCNCNEYDRKLKEKFIIDLNDETIIAEISIGITSLKDTVSRFNVGPESRSTKSTEGSVRLY